jgi:hypothetical protein
VPYTTLELTAGRFRCLFAIMSSVCDILEGEGYTVCRAHNDYEGLPFARTGFMALTGGTVLYIVVF